MKTKIFYTTFFILFNIFIFGCSDDLSIEPENEISEVPRDNEFVGTESVRGTETFVFSSNGNNVKGKIYLPDAYDTNKNLPVIYLIDFQEQHFKVAKDEFVKVINGVSQVEGLDALVVTLEEHLYKQATPEGIQPLYDIFKDMTSYVDEKYANNASRTFMGRGNEAGVVMMVLFLEDSENSIFDNFIATDPSSNFNYFVLQMIEKNNFPKNKQNKKLHFSFSANNDADQSNKIIQLMNEAQYPWLEFDSFEYSNGHFENTYPAAFTRGIKYIFNE